MGKFSKLGLFVTAASMMFATVATADQKLAIGTTSSKSAFYGYFVAVSNILNEKVEGVTAKAVETGATIDNINRMGRDQLDMGLVTTNALSDAYEGVGKFEGKPVKSKILWVYYMAPQVTLVREDSGIKTFADLSGKKFNPGLRGSSTEATTDGVFKTLGISVDAFRGGSADARDAVKNNQIIGMTSSSTGDKYSSTQVDLSTFTTMLPLTISEKQAALIKENHPQLTIVDIPAGAGNGTPPFTTWAFALATSASPTMDTETAYKIVKAVFENRQQQTDAMKSTGAVDFAQATVDLATSPLHPGAIKYLQEIGIVVPDHLIAPEDK
ncbi:MAG: TRAP transporter substrate-binding protein [Sneathiella sp.]|nr:MAG: TRAP transporter substrate-binding protein [Sneathiella sp.]